MRACRSLSVTVHFSSVQFKMVSMRSGKPIICAAPCLSEVCPTLPFEIVPVFFWLTMALSRPFREGRLALPHSCLSDRVSHSFPTWGAVGRHTQSQKLRNFLFTSLNRCSIMDKLFPTKLLQMEGLFTSISSFNMQLVSRLIYTVWRAREKRTWCV